MTGIDYIEVLGVAVLTLIFLGALAGVAILFVRTLWYWGRK